MQHSCSKFDLHESFNINSLDVDAVYVALNLTA